MKTVYINCKTEKKAGLLKELLLNAGFDFDPDGGRCGTSAHGEGTEIDMKDKSAGWCYDYEMENPVDFSDIINDSQIPDFTAQLASIRERERELDQLKTKLGKDVKLILKGVK